MEGGESFPLGPGQDYTLIQAGFAEVIFTFLLCYVVCYTATVQDAPLTQYFGLAMSSCVTAGGHAIGAVSAGSLNPAVSVSTAPVVMSTAALGLGWPTCKLRASSWIMKPLCHSLDARRILICLKLAA